MSRNKGLLNRAMPEIYQRQANPVARALAAVPFEPVEKVGKLGIHSKIISNKILNLKGNNWASSVNGQMRSLAQVGDSQIKTLSKSEARYCKGIFSEIMNRHDGDIDAGREAYTDLFIYVDGKGIEVPDFKKHGFIPSCRRMMHEKWWRRKLRVKKARELEAKLIDERRVSDKSETYVSNRTLERRRAQREHNARILQGINAINQMGQEYTLYDLAALSVSNPKIRRMELMTRIRGFEEFADSIGFKAMFFTWTCPSRMHSNHGSKKVKGRWIPGVPNKKYDGTTPKQAQEYLSNQWAKARAELDRRGLVRFGFRVVEPHHDGTPHWHMLFFMPRKQRFEIAEVLKHYAMQIDGSEAGAEKYRFKVEDIKTGVNPETGRKYSAAGYIAKYISKAIDGYGVETDLYGNDAAKGAERIEAWASTWGIRQFQQIGGPSITVWRELRRLRDEQINGSKLLDSAREAANAGDWAEYCRLNWHEKITLLKKQVEKGELNQYGDEKQMSIYGVEAGNVGVVTRRHVWEIGGEADTAKRPEVAKPWTGVNNCTEVQLKTAVDLFNRDYSTVHHSRVKWAIEQGFSEISAFENVKREAMAGILADKYGFNPGPVKPERDFMILLRKKWHEAAPRELLLEEWEDSGGGDFEAFINWHFSEFCRDYLWKKYGVVYE